MSVGPLLVAEPVVVDYRNAALLQNHLHGYLVHAVCRCQCVAACVGDTRELHYSLECTVLAVCAVECRENDIETCYNILLEHAFFGAVEVCVAVDGLHINFLTHCKELLGVAVVGNIAQCRTSVPFTLLCDVYRGYLILLCVHCSHCLVGCNYRNLVLDGAAAEYNAYICFHRLYICFCFSSIFKAKGNYLKLSGKSFS